MSFNEWKKVKLSEISVGNRGNYGIGASAVDYDENLYTYLRITDITDDGRLNKEGLKSVEDKDAQNYLLSENDIVFARTGNSTGRAYFYEPSDGELVYAGFLIKFKLDETKVNPRYIKLYTMTKEYKNWIESISTGSTRKNVNAKMYGDMDIKLPSREEQNFIVSLIEPLSKKIEVNNKINKRLEYMAQSIFKYWFIDFEFPNEEGKPYKSSGGEIVESELGMIPKGWEVKELGELSNIVGGGTPSTKIEEYYNGDIPWITPKDLSGYDRKFIKKGARSITQLGLDKSSAKVLPKGSVLFSSRAPIGYISIAENMVTTNQGFKSIDCSEGNISNNYVYYTLINQLEDIKNNATGSTFKEISGLFMKKLKVILPNKNILNKFEIIIQSIDLELKKNYKEIDTLMNLRDILLPKLMNGEIRVPFKK